MQAKTARMILLKLLMMGACVYFGLALLLYLIQGRILFPASANLYRNPANSGWAFDDVVLDVGGEKTHGWYIPLEEARGVALFSHGNAGNIADRVESIGLLRSLGLSVLAYDYGGYGKSTGKPSETRIEADALAMWHHLVDTRGFAPEEILLFGRSLGAAATLGLATKVQPAAVVAESAFTSTPDVAAYHYPYFPVRWCLRHQFRNIEKIGGIHCPILIIHGREDTLIPFAHGEALFERANAPKTFLEIHGDHNDGFVLSIDAYRAAWEKFLDEVLPK